MSMRYIAKRRIGDVERGAQVAESLLVNRHRDGSWLEVTEYTDTLVSGYSG